MASGWSKDPRSRQERGYGAAWDRARKRVIARDSGICQPCKRKGQLHVGSEVDHIISKAKGGTDDDSNLECICHEAHKLKTIEETGRQLRRGGCDINGMPLDASHHWREPG